VRAVQLLAAARGGGRALLGVPRSAPAAGRTALPATTTALARSSAHAERGYQTWPCGTGAAVEKRGSGRTVLYQIRRSGSALLGEAPPRRARASLKAMVYSG